MVLDILDFKERVLKNHFNEVVSSLGDEIAERTQVYLFN